MNRSGAALAIAGLLLPLAPSGADACVSGTPPALGFAAPVYVDRTRAGGEPVSVVAHDGAILVSAHAGTTQFARDEDNAAGLGDFAVGYANQTLNWRSTDGGATWRYVGLAGLPAGPHSPASSGFADPDLTIDADGRIYNTEINVLNVSVYSSLDDGRSWPVANPLALTVADRPWVTAAGPGELYLTAHDLNFRPFLYRSTDGGLTFANVLDYPPVVGKLVVDPLNPANGLIGLLPGFDGVAISANKGQTWTSYPGAGLGPRSGLVANVAVDRTGHVYLAAAGETATGSGKVTFASLDRSTGTWTARTIATPARRALWAWAVAGDDGRVAVAWLQETAASTYRVDVAYTLNGHGGCGGVTFTTANASGRAVHVGDVCLDGLNCALGLSSDRRLGDFLTANIDKAGHVFVVVGDTTIPTLTDGQKPVANPLFLKQNAGTPLLATPDATRPTCLVTPVVC